MTHTTDPINQLTQELHRRSRGHHGKEVMERFQAAGIKLFDANDPLELVRIFHRQTHTVTGADRSLDALVALTPHDEDAGLVVLVALRPALYRIAQRNQSSTTSLEETIADVILFAWESTLEAAKMTSGNRVSFIVRSTATKTRTISRRQHRHDAHLNPLDDYFDVVDDSRTIEPWPEESLHRAQSAGVLSDFDVELIHSTRIGDVDLHEMAIGLNLPYDRLQKQRRRAEVALCNFILNEEDR